MSNQEMNVISFDVKVSPNPTIESFKIQIVTDEIQKINIRILKAPGTLIREMILSPYQKNISIGSDLPAGNYIIEVRQGNNTKKIKLLKY